MKKAQFSVLLGMMVAGASMRLIPHLPNFTPIAAMALFGGAQFAQKRWAFLVALGSMFLSDVFLELLSGRGFHDQMLFVYGSFALIVLLGTTLRNRKRVFPVAFSSLAASSLFYVLTNFGVWMAGGLYPLTPQGLLACYGAAIPFFGHTAAGDLFYSGVFFGAYAWIERRLGWLATTPSSSGGLTTT